MRVHARHIVIVITAGACRLVRVTRHVSRAREGHRCAVLRANANSSFGYRAALRFQLRKKSAGSQTGAPSAPFVPQNWTPPGLLPVCVALWVSMNQRLINKLSSITYWLAVEQYSLWLLNTWLSQVNLRIIIIIIHITSWLKLMNSVWCHLCQETSRSIFRITSIFHLHFTTHTKTWIFFSHIFIMYIYIFF